MKYAKEIREKCLYLTKSRKNTAAKLPNKNQPNCQTKYSQITKQNTAKLPNYIKKPSDFQLFILPLQHNQIRIKKIAEYKKRIADKILQEKLEALGAVLFIRRNQ